jgi:hypothetical protein
VSDHDIVGFGYRFLFYPKSTNSDRNTLFSIFPVRIMQIKEAKPLKEGSDVRRITNNV